MCYASPGPRCSAHALEQMERAQLAFDRAMTSKSKAEAKAALDTATKAYYMTPAGFATLEAKIADLRAERGYSSTFKADLLQERLDDCKNARAAQIAELKVAGIKFEEEATPTRCEACGQFTSQDGHVCSSSTDPFVSQADMSTWTPVQVDERLEETMIAKYKLWDERDKLKASLDETERLLDPNSRWYNTFEVSRRQERKQELEDKIAQIDQKLTEEIKPREQFYEAEYQRRGGWTRAFIVTNANGHVHKNMSCSSCYSTTRYAWLTRFSGTTEDEVVEAAGERACTVCYPSAPVELLNRPTTVFTPEEEQRRVEREQAAQRRTERQAAAAAKAITTPSGQPLRTSSWGLIKTERTAQSQYVELMAYRDVGYSNIDQGEIDLLAASLAHKRGISLEEFADSMRSKVAAKVRSFR